MFVGATQSGYGSGGGSTALSLPGGILAGDIIMVWASTSLNSINVTSGPAGYTQDFGVDYFNDGNDNLLYQWHKVAVGGESSAVVSWNTGSVTYRGMVACVYRNIGTYNASAPAWKVQGSGVSSTMTSNSFTDAPVGGFNVIAWWANRSSLSNIDISTPPSGMTQRGIVDGNTDPGGRPDVILSVYDQLGVGGGSVSRSQIYDTASAAQICGGATLEA